MRNPPVAISDQTLAERLRAATELLEWIASDRERLEELPPQDRERLHRAVADFYNPDPVARRRKIKEAERERMATRSQRVGAVLQETGIRTSAAQAHFHHAQCFSARGVRRNRMNRVHCRI